MGLLIWASYEARHRIRRYIDPRERKDKQNYEHLFNRLAENLFTADGSLIAVRILKDLQSKYPMQIMVFDVPSDQPMKTNDLVEKYLALAEAVGD